VPVLYFVARSTEATRQQGGDCKTFVLLGEVIGGGGRRRRGGQTSNAWLLAKGAGGRASEKAGPSKTSNTLPPIIPTLPDSMPPSHTKTHIHNRVVATMALRPLPLLLLVLLLVLVLDLLSSTTAFLHPSPPQLQPQQQQLQQQQQQQQQQGGIVRRGGAAAGVALAAAGAGREGKGEEEVEVGKNERMVSRRHRRTPALEEQREMRASR